MLMKIDFITLFPELIEHYLSQGLLSRAAKNDLLTFKVHNLRNQAVGNYKSVDDTAYGGGDGQVIQYAPLKKALLEIPREPKSKVIYFSPQGQLLDQKKLEELTSANQLILISGRYAGVDQRFISQFVDEEISIGNYILSGGELPSLVLTESVSRLIPGVLGDSESSQQDSLSSDLLGQLEASQFTKPFMIDNLKVPEVLSSGNHQKIKEWKRYISTLQTLKKRPELVYPHQDWKQVLYFYLEISAEDKKNLQIENLEIFLKERIK